MQIINKQDVQARAYGDYSIRLYFMHTGVQKKNVSRRSQIPGASRRR